MENDFNSGALDGLPLEHKRELLRSLLEEKLNAVDSHVLSFAQQRLWFLDALSPDNSVYNIPFALKIKGDLSDENLRKSLHEIIRRHECLRTKFLAIKGKPHQVVSIDFKLDYTIVDLTHLQCSVRTETALQRARSDIERPFKLGRDPLLRVRLYKIDIAEHIVLIVMHHIISDGWSFGIFFKELSLLYQAYKANEPVTLERLPIQYSAYAKLQRQRLTGETLERLVGYWRKALQGAPPLFQMATDRDRPSLQTFEGKKYFFEIDSIVTEKLKSIGHQSGSSLYMTLLTALTILLHKYSGEEDIVIGTASSGRNDKSIEPLIGFFSNLLPIRSTIDPTDTFRKQLVKIREIVFDAFEHQELPFDKIVEELVPERDLSYNPIVQIGFSFLNDQLINTSILGFETEQIAIDRDVVRFDLDFALREQDSGLRGFVLYNISLYDSSTIERLIQHFKILIENILLNPDSPIKSLSLLSSYERAQLQEWNSTIKDYPKNKTVYELFQAQVEKTPDNIALVYEGKTLTYKTLNEKSNQLARHIREQYQKRTERRFKPDTLITLYLDKSLEMVIGILGVLKAGGAYVPLDPSYPQDRIDYLLEDTQAMLILSQRHVTESSSAQLLAEKIVHIDLTEALYDQHDTADLPAHSAATNLAYVIYTSGTTGKPKGVMIEHRSINNLVQNQSDFFDIKSGDVAMQFASYVFDASVSEIFAAITTGATLVIVPNSIRRDPYLINEFIENNRVNVATLPPVLLSAMRYKNFLHLRTLIVAGEVCPTEVMNKWSRGRRLINAYGPTENTVCATMHRYEEGDRNTNIGRPLDNIRLSVLDENLSPVPIGVIGELYIGGAGLARGYLNNDLTAQYFIPNVFAKDADKAQGFTNMYKTGDLVRWLADGSLEYIRRNDDQIKIRGYRVELAEIEHALSQVRGIKQSCVLSKEKSTDAGSIKYLLGYYIADSTNESLNQSAILDELGKTLPGYMVPSALVAMESFPLTINGKLDKLSLPDPILASAPAGFILPTTEQEIAIAKIWQEMLGLEKVSITEDFFKLGGNSILAIQIAYQMSQVLDSDIKVADVFDLKNIQAILKKFTISDEVDTVEWDITN